MKVQPLHDWAVIRPSEPEAVTAGGLYIPDTAKDKPQEGVIEAIGPGALEEEKRDKKKGEKKERRFIPTVLKPGDRVAYGRYAGQTYTIEGEELLLVRERDILGILPGERAVRQEPLQIPARTASAGVTALMKPASPPSPARPAATKKKAAKKAKKAAKKAVTKKKAVVKSAKAKAAPKAKPGKGTKKKGKKKK